MSDVISSLKEIVEKYPSVLEDEKKLKSILRDYFPEDKRIQNQLYMVVDEGILEDMQGCSEIKRFKMLGYIHSLASDYGITELMAKNAIMLWVDALSITADDVSVIRDINKQTNEKEVSVIEYSDSFIDNDKITGKIYKFNGGYQRVYTGITLEKTNYVVKIRSENYINAYYIDCNGKEKLLFSHNSCEEVVSFIDDSINLSKPGIIKIGGVYAEKWSVEMIPM